MAIVCTRNSNFSKIFWPVLAWGVAIDVFLSDFLDGVSPAFKTDADAVKPEHLFVFKADAGKLSEHDGEL